MLHEKAKATDSEHPWSYTLAAMALTAVMAAIAIVACAGGEATGLGWVAGAAVGLIMVVDAWTGPGT